MAMAAEDRIATIAQQVRRLRQDRGLSLNDLALRSATSKSTVTQVESGTGNPTIATLEALARALSVTLEDLLMPLQPPPGMVVVRRGEGVDISDAVATGLLVSITNVEAARIEFHALTLHGGMSETSASHGAGSHEHVIVVSGRVRAGPIGGEASVLEAGDYAHYPADRAHQWSAPDADASIWIVAIFPRAADGQA